MLWIIFVLTFSQSCYCHVNKNDEEFQPNKTDPLEETTSIMNESAPLIYTAPLNDTTPLNKTSPLNGTTPENQSPQPVSQDKNIFDWFTGLFNSITGNTNSGPSTSMNAGSPASSVEREPEPSKSCTPCRCGEPLATTDNRIINGQETMVHEFRWMTFLTYARLPISCGATVISNKYLLTAAHCIIFKDEKVTLSFMLHDRSDPAKSMAFTRMSSDIIIHPDFDSETFDSDIALVKLDQPLIFNDTLKPVCLPTLGQSYAGFDGIATGWGLTKEDDVFSVSKVLRKVTLPIISQEDCMKLDVDKGEITKNMLCAGFKEGGRDTCQGDSGGPLHILNTTSNRYQQVGIVSFGDGCARANEPGVNTRVTRFLDWIKQNTKGECFCE